MSGGGANVLPPQLYTLRDGRSGQFTTFDDATKQKEYNLKPGETKVLAEHLTPGIITRMWFTLSGWFWENWDGDDESRWPDATILKKVILRIYWDGNPFPFGRSADRGFLRHGPVQYRPYLSDFIGLSRAASIATSRCRSESAHRSAEPARPAGAGMFLNANYQALDALPPGAGRFHCLYNAGTNPGSKPIEILQAKGRGHFVGCALSIQGRQPNYLGFLEAPEYFLIEARRARRPPSPARAWRIISTAAGISARANSPGRITACR